jgi:hypothetical protein
MGRARQEEQAVHDEGSRSEAMVPIALARLERRFTQFRAKHRRGARYPDELRQAALGLLGEVAPDALYRACGLTFRQVMAWRGAGPAAAKEQEFEAGKVRVFSVVDPPPTLGAEPQESAPELELQIRPGSVSVRLTWRGGTCCP